MPKTREQKSALIERLVKEFKGAKSAIFADYQGITVVKVDELRKKMREANVTYIAAKKTLIRLAAKEAGFEINPKNFPGMLGIAFGTEDEIAPARILGEMTKTTTLKLVGGIFDGAPIEAEKAITLSKLPTKQQLLGQLVGTMYAPVSGFVRALNAIRESKENATQVAA